MTEAGAEEIRDVQHTHCAVVGGGPGGLLLALLLARAGVPVTLLEAHRDFDRDFRGDTVHAGTLEVLDQVGLADRLLQLPHAKLHAMQLKTATATYTLVDFRRLRTRFPYVTIMPQVRFLNLLAEEAARYPHFRLVLGANVQRLVEEDGAVRGVRYRADDGWHEVRAPLTVAADGRFSRLRKLAELEPVSQAPEMDILWLRLPRRPDDRHDEGTINVGNGHFLVLLGRETEWQGGYAFPKGGFQKVKAEGLPALQQSVAALVPFLADRVALLDDWHKVSVLSVESNRLPRWHRPGLLCIGDAAHVMSPVGGIGINYAIGDAVEAANVLGPKLRTGSVGDGDLAEVQKRREWPVKVAQRVQAFMQKRLVGEALYHATTGFKPPLPLRLIQLVPGLRNLPGHLWASGIRRVRLEHPEEVPPSQTVG